MRVLTDTHATRIDVADHTLDILDPAGIPQQLSYDALVVGTGAISARPPITGLTGPDALGPKDGCNCYIPWATPSPCWTPSPRATRRARPSSAPATSAWRWPKH